MQRISIHFFPEHRHSMAQIITLYFELGIKFSDVVLRLNWHGYIISESKLHLSRRTQSSDLEDTEADTVLRTTAQIQMTAHL